MKTAVIYSAKRTAIGSFMGNLSSISASQLGATAARAALMESGLKPAQIDEAIMGSVLTAGQGQAPARQVAIFSELPISVRAMTINKVCGSGLKALSLAADRIALGRAGFILAGGMENMSQCPYYVTKARAGFRMGNQELIDGMIHDGLWDVYNRFHMGNAAELCAREYKFTREQQDQFARESYERALKSIQEGLFKSEIVGVEIQEKKNKITVEIDEEPGRGQIEKFSTLRPAFDKEGTVTAANASSLNDGAAALILGPEDEALRHKAMAKIIHTTEYAHEPEWFTTAPVACVKKLLSETSLKVGDITSFEINEAFSVVAMAAQKELGIPRDCLNPRGGAVALGHPIGASGARLMTTLIHTLKKGEKGIASLCIGGGEAIAMLVERL
ncbi:MAG: acetyl-CoA C-acyltransferase [Deltaproteobacteria bacterium CG11_big_fil_rev_8_21_14_0_20_45_16]|nr:MAG: acetyl-CoA C-acyltransferase [Deltaproteobacteria bacterium CG11_big_fil_rev_8_21_14_0_20_45_16]